MATYISKDTLVDRINQYFIDADCVLESTPAWLREYIIKNDNQQIKHPGKLLFEVDVDIENIGRRLKILRDNERVKIKVKNQNENLGSIHCLGIAD